MQTYPAICFVKIGLAVLLSANLIFGIAKADTHQAGVGETIFENTVLATDHADRDQAAQEQGARESDDAAHGPGDCHIHVILLKEAKLTCDRSLVDSSRQWGDVPVILASVQGYYRPPRG